MDCLSKEIDTRIIFTSRYNDDAESSNTSSDRWNNTSTFSVTTVVQTQVEQTFQMAIFCNVWISKNVNLYIKENLSDNANLFIKKYLNQNLLFLKNNKCQRNWRFIRFKKKI